MKLRRLPPNVSDYRDARGKTRYRFRKNGFSAELGTEFGSPEFLARLDAARQEIKLRREGGAGAGRTLPGSINALVASFYRSPEFLALSRETQKGYRGQIEPFRREHGHRPVAGLRPAHVAAILARKAATPAAANNLRKRLRQLMEHAVRLELRPDNPVKATKPYRIAGDGFHTWTEAEIAAFYEKHPPGTLAHRAMTLMLYTGAAKVDAVKLGWRNIEGGRLRYRRQKTETAGGELIDIPLHPDLAAVLSECDRDAFTFLQTQRGASRSPNGLGNLMREWCDAAGLPECTAHGLRKAIARRLAEAKATPHEIAAVTGHKSLAEITRYTEKADRADLADSAMERLPGQADRVAKVANLSSMFAKSPTKPMKRKGE